MSHLEIDETHDPSLISSVSAANDLDADFPIQNLPFGVFRKANSNNPEFTGGVAIGESILDLSAASRSGLFSGAAASAAQSAALGQLNTFMALGRPAWRALRIAVSQILREDFSKRDKVQACLVPINKAEMGLPARVGNYTDFFASIHHAQNVGKLFRPDNPLLPNYKYVPIAYHGRASSVKVSHSAFHRPVGQLPVNGQAPIVGPSRRLDYEFELGFWIGPGNLLGEPIEIQNAEDHWFGVSLLNDWSARDIQAWEYQPLGPFLAKNFMTTVSPWIVSLEALAPFRSPLAARPEGDPPPLAYLSHELVNQHGGLNLQLEAWIRSAKMAQSGAPAFRLSQTNASHLYWTPGQMITHHSMGGCNLESGDLFGSGTTSGPNVDGLGCLLELTEGGKKAIELPSGETRQFLEDGDSIELRAFCQRDGFRRIGFGSCAGTVLPARVG